MIPSMKEDFKALNQFVAGLDKTRSMVVKVGILGNKNTRSSAIDMSAQTNSDIGAKHEYGSFADRIPQRSFLWMPLLMRGKEIMVDVAKNAKADILAGRVKQALAKLGVACETVIGDAFETGGFGQWKPLSDFTIERKIQHNPQPLINTRQLQRSVTSVVEAKK
jgi:hypothetical protein